MDRVNIVSEHPFGEVQNAMGTRHLSKHQRGAHAQQQNQQVLELHAVIELA